MSAPSYTYTRAQYPTLLRRILWFDAWRSVPSTRARVGDRLPNVRGGPSESVIVQVSGDVLVWAYIHQVKGP